MLCRKTGNCDSCGRRTSLVFWRDQWSFWSFWSWVTSYRMGTDVTHGRPHRLFWDGDNKTTRRRDDETRRRSHIHAPTRAQSTSSTRFGILNENVVSDGILYGTEEMRLRNAPMRDPFLCRKSIMVYALCLVSSFLSIPFARPSPLLSYTAPGGIMGNG